MHAFEKLTHLVDGEPRIISDPPLIVPIEELLPERIERDAVEDEMRDLIRAYRRTLETDRRHLLEQFRFVDLARKVVGVGSVGTRAWIALFLGIDEQDPLFLQVKEAQPSVLEQFVGKSEYNNSGQRVVAGQRLMQATSDIFLGWQHVSCRPRRPRARLLRPPAQGLEGLVRLRGSRPGGRGRLRAERAAGRSPAPMPAPATGSRSPPTSASRTPSTGQSPTSPRPTPTRTNATTTLSSERSSRAGSLREPGSRGSSPRGREFHRGATSERRGIQPKRMMILARLGT